MISAIDDRTRIIADICRTLDARNLTRPYARETIILDDAGKGLKLTAAAYAAAWARAWATLPSAAETIAAWRRAVAMLPSAEEAAKGLRTDRVRRIEAGEESP